MYTLLQTPLMDVQNKTKKRRKEKKKAELQRNITKQKNGHCTCMHCLGAKVPIPYAASGNNFSRPSTIAATLLIHVVSSSLFRESPFSHMGLKWKITSLVVGGWPLDLR